MGDKKAVERYYEQAKVVVKDYTQTGSLASGSGEDITINPPPGKIWRCLNIRFRASYDADATAGYHNMEIRSVGGWPRYMHYKSGYSTHLIINDNNITNADQHQRPATDAALATATQNILLTPDEGIVLHYYNGFDVAQENDRNWQLRFLEIPLERVV